MMVASTVIVISMIPHSSVMAAGASVPLFVLAPVRLNGHVRYAVSTLFPVTAAPPTTTVLQTIEGSLSARTRAYIWQPWFLRMTARLGVVTSRSMASKNTNALDVTGRGDIVFLPRSTFPFHAYIEQQTQSPDDALFGIERLITRYGADQIWIARSAMYQLDYNASVIRNRSSLANQISNDSFSDMTTATAFLRRPGNDLRLKGSYRREILDGVDAKHWGRNINASHRFRPSPDVDINSLASFDHTVDKNGPRYLTSKFSQVSSGFSWRPLKKRWSIAGSVVGRQSNSNGKSSNSAAASIGGNAWVKHSERWNSSVGANAAKAKDEPALFSQRFSSAYTYRTRILGLGYNWSVRGGINNSLREGENSQNYRASTNHGINRAVSFWGERVNLNFVQGLNETYATNDRVMATTLSHNASIGWSTSTPLSSMQMRLSFSVGHNWGSFERKGQSRLANFQLSRRQTLTRYSRLTANITAQAAKVSTLSEGTDGYTGSLIGILRYSHVRLFNVPNMRMQSTFSIGSRKISPSSGLPTDFDLDTWETRVDYFFGKIISTLLLRISGSEGDYFGSVSFTVTRRFG
ncbi:MAG: hypothetical protein R8K46_00905 [Mariprofundaceae bacterium]